MRAKTDLKRMVRQVALWGMRGASRPTLLYDSRHPDMAQLPHRVLIIRPDHLGDILMMTPALAWLRQALPQAEITVLVGPWGAASLQNNPDIDHIVRCQFPGFSRQPKTSFYEPYLYALQQSRLLRANNYDVAINLRYDFWWGALLTYLADIPVRFGYDWPEARPFLTHALAFQAAHEQKISFSAFGQPPQHSVALNLALVRFALEKYQSLKEVHNPEDVRLKFEPSAEDRRFVQLHLSEWGINRSDKVVVIHPGGGASIKLWTVEGFAAVNDALVERYGAKVVLAGGDSENVLLNNIVKLCKHKPLRWDTSLNWARLAALFEQASLVLGLDSGPLHLAVTVDAPTIHLFGPTDNKVYGPWGDPARHRVVHTEIDLPCCPCNVLDFQRACWKGGYCMRTIKPAQVLDVVEQLTGWPVLPY